MIDSKLKYKYEIVDQSGRLWARTLTRIKAIKLVEYLRETKGLICRILEIA